MNKGGQPESALVSELMEQFFIPVPGPFQAWLLYDSKTGAGLVLALGSFRSSRQLRKGKLPLAAVAVDPRFQPTLAPYGPGALKWNGREIVVAIMGMN